MYFYYYHYKSIAMNKHKLWVINISFVVSDTKDSLISF